MRRDEEDCGDAVLFEPSVDSSTSAALFVLSHADRELTRDFRVLALREAARSGASFNHQKASAAAPVAAPVAAATSARPAAPVAATPQTIAQCIRDMMVEANRMHTMSYDADMLQYHRARFQEARRHVHSKMEQLETTGPINWGMYASAVEIARSAINSRGAMSADDEYNLHRIANRLRRSGRKQKSSSQMYDTFNWIG